MRRLLRSPLGHYHSKLYISIAALAALLSVGCGSAAPPPQAPAPFVARAGAIAYRFPVVGTWRVLRTHYGAKNDQAYALDLVVPREESVSGLNRKAATARGNERYPSYRRPIVADGPGVIAIAVDGVPDNEPGAVNRYDMHGNFVVIDHENGEYSLMAHFIPGSIKVRVGERVAAGAELGLCGNSGHSTLPHLHWQVMDNVNASIARGIAPKLLPYERNGAMSAELPQAGDTLLAR